LREDQLVLGIAAPGLLPIRNRDAVEDAVINDVAKQRRRKLVVLGTLRVLADADS